MERCNKTKAERCELIFKMDYILLMFLIEKNLLEKFIDNCNSPMVYFNTNNILTASPWRDPNMYKWNSAQLEFEIYNVSTELRIKEILGRR